MSTITIQVPSDKDSRVADAYDLKFPGRVLAGMTKPQWIKYQLIQSIKQVVKYNESTVDANVAKGVKDAEIDAFNIT